MSRKGVPDGISRSQLIEAIELIEDGYEHNFADSTKFDVLYEGERYPPKAVVGVAAELLNGTQYFPDDFSGGESSKCSRIILQNGLEIVPKRSNTMGQTVLRVTGPPENFLTAMKIGFWAVNEKNKKTWGRLRKGDVILFHSSTKSKTRFKPTASVIGYARVGNQKFIKDELWWIDEVEDKENHWPFVFSLDHICLFANLSDSLDLSRAVHEKNEETLAREVEALSEAGFPLIKLNHLAKSIDPEYPQFPVNGSISSVNEIYPKLLFSELAEEIWQCHGKTVDPEIEKDLVSDHEESELAKLTKEELLVLAKQWKAPYSGSHKKAWRRVRREDAKQKRIIAEIEDNTCQVCGFHAPYINSKGKLSHVIHVDHIEEKSDEGDESIANLWVLCPNCHAKKTFGVIEIDVTNKQVFENGEPVEIRDSHLFVNV